LDQRGTVGFGVLPQKRLFLCTRVKGDINQQINVQCNTVRFHECIDCRKHGQVLLSCDDVDMHIDKALKHFYLCNEVTFGYKLGRLTGDFWASPIGRSSIYENLSMSRVRLRRSTRCEALERWKKKNLTS
jgi:hypothetical protein